MTDNLLTENSKFELQTTFFLFQMSQQENENPSKNEPFEVIRDIPKLHPGMGFFERLYWKEMKQIGKSCKNRLGQTNHIFSCNGG